MTTEAAKRAADLANAETVGGGWRPEDFAIGKSGMGTPFTKYIQHVSDVAERVRFEARSLSPELSNDLRALILPKPIDALKLAYDAAVQNCEPHASLVDQLRTELAKRGARIVFDGGE